MVVMIFMCLVNHLWVSEDILLTTMDAGSDNNGVDKVV